MNFEQAKQAFETLLPMARERLPGHVMIRGWGEQEPYDELTEKDNGAPCRVSLSFTVIVDHERVKAYWRLYSPLDSSKDVEGALSDMIELVSKMTSEKLPGGAEWRDRVFIPEVAGSDG